MGGLEDADPLSLYWAAAVLVEALQDILRVRDALADIDLKLDREDLADIDLFLGHEQLEEGQLVSGAIRGGGAGFHSGQLQERCLQRLPADFSLEHGNDELARLGRRESIALRDAGRVFAIDNSDVLRGPAPGNLQIGHRRQRGE